MIVTNLWNATFPTDFPVSLLLPFRLFLARFRIFFVTLDTLPREGGAIFVETAHRMK